LGEDVPTVLKLCLVFLLYRTGFPCSFHLPYPRWNDFRCSAVLDLPFFFSCRSFQLMYSGFLLFPPLPLSSAVPCSSDFSSRLGSPVSSALPNFFLFFRHFSPLIYISFFSPPPPKRVIRLTNFLSTCLLPSPVLLPLVPRVFRPHREEQCRHLYPTFLFPVRFDQNNVFSPVPCGQSSFFFSPAIPSLPLPGPIIYILCPAFLRYWWPFFPSSPWLFYALSLF